MKVTDTVMETVISEVVGSDTLPLVKALLKQKNQSEFMISTKIKTPVDVIRNRLYKLYNNNLVTYIRKKDKKKGWYIYYWTLNLNRIKYLEMDLKQKKIERLKERVLREESNNFFSCTNGCIRVDFDQATNFNYQCPECGEILNQEDNVDKIDTIKKEIIQLEKDLKKIKDKTK